MKKYKYIGTEEQLVERGFKCDEYPFYWRGYVGFTVVIDVKDRNIDISNDVDDIQDLIDANLVEELEND